MKKKHFSLLRRSRRHDAPDTAAIMEVERKNILSEKKRRIQEALSRSLAHESEKVP